MKRSIFTFVCAILFVLPLTVKAQKITIGQVQVINGVLYLNASSSTVGIETDSMARVDMSSAIFPIMQADTNFTKDFTNLFYNSFYNRSFGGSVSPYQNTDSVSYPIGPLAYWVYNDNFFVQTGWKGIHQHIDTQAIVMKRVNKDSTTVAFTFNYNYKYGPGFSHTIAYDTHLPFPLTYTNSPLTTWGNNYHVTHGFTIKDSDTSLHCGTYKPGYNTEYVVESDTVVGWGKIKINKKDSTPSGFIRVLQVKKVMSFRDSISIPNPVNQSIFDTLGLAHSYTRKVYEMDFLTTELLAPVVKVFFTDSTMTIPQNGEVYVGNLNNINLVVNVQNISQENNNFTVYPNPVNNGNINIQIADAKDGNWSYTLCNASGQIIAIGSLPFSANNSKVQLSLPQGMANGMYFMQINNNGQNNATVRLVIAK
jgi:hypothetical protein